MLSILVNILLFALVIGILVFVHELGHFLAAKSVKATIYEFSMGFGPKLFSKKKDGILYAIRIIPLGGYVKIAGDGDPSGDDRKKEKEDPNSLSNKSKIAQAWVMCAGVIMNLLLSIVIYFIILGTNGWVASLSSEFKDFNPIVGEISYESIDDVRYSGIVEDSGAEKANIPEEGIIKRIDDEKIEYAFQISDTLEGKENTIVEVQICEEENCGNYQVLVSDEGYLGVMVYSNYIVNISYENSKPIAGIGHLVNVLKVSIQKISGLFAEAKETGDYGEVANTFTGPVGIYLVLDYFKQFGFISILSIVADLSLSLAVMNILPIPALDGGRVLILLIESITRKDLDEKVEEKIINISFIILIVFIAVIFVKDMFSIESIKSMFQ